MRLFDGLGALIEIGHKARVISAMPELEEKGPDQTSDGSIVERESGGVTGMKTRSERQRESADTSNSYEKSH